MDATRLLLAIDSFVNLLLGALLVVFPESLARLLGVPIPESAFYPSVFGGVLFGIGIALALEYWQPQERLGGLGLGGAIAINMSGRTGPVGAVARCPTRFPQILHSSAFFAFLTLSETIASSIRSSERPTT